MSANQLPHPQKVLLYAAGVIDELINIGLIDGPHPISSGGQDAFLDLKAAGFKPSDDELKAAVRILTHGLGAPYQRRSVP
jgi:hypothetical protein